LPFKYLLKFDKIYQYKQKFEKKLRLSKESLLHSRLAPQNVLELEIIISAIASIINRIFGVTLFLLKI